MALTQVQPGMLGNPQPYNFKNRLINGAMVIDQRNSGASITANDAVFGVDRWTYYAYQNGKGTIQQNQGAVTPPAGFVNYLGFTSSSAYSVPAGEAFLFQQRIEGFNIADLGWGAANAKTVTLSFWVRSSLTGTFGGSLRNSAGTRSYPFSYTINSANTWEYETITIAGDTSGTWLTTNGIGVYVSLNLGTGSTFSGTAGSWAGANYWSATGATSVVGTNGATFYITGVQLEVGNNATGFDYRPYGTELALCQRYYYKMAGMPVGSPFGAGFVQSSTQGNSYFIFPVSMRASPSTLDQTGTASDYQYRFQATSVAVSSVPTLGETSPNTAFVYFPVASGLTAGNGGVARAATTNAYLGFGAEL